MRSLGTSFSRSSRSYNIMSLHQSVADARKISDIAYEYALHGLNDSALFWMEMAHLLDPEDSSLVCAFVMLMYSSGQYHRITSFLMSRNDPDPSGMDMFLRASAYHKLKDYNAATMFLAEANKKLEEDCPSLGPGHGYAPIVRSLLCQLQADISLELSKTDNITKYVDSFRSDPCNIQALDKIRDLQIIPEKDVLSMIDFSSDSIFGDADVASFCRACLKTAVSHVRTPPGYEHALSRSVDVRLAEARHLFSLRSFRDCAEILSSILNEQGLHEGCTLLYPQCLMQLGETHQLGVFSQEMAKSQPTSYQSYFALACYSFAVGDLNQAVLKLQDAIQRYPACPILFLYLGHAYSLLDACHSAINSYFVASKYVPTSHIPLFNIGVEYTRVGLVSLALVYFVEALKWDKSSPEILNELGFVFFQLGEHRKSISLFKKALDGCSACSRQDVDDLRGTILSNLGFCHLRTQQFSSACEYFLLADRALADNVTKKSVGVAYYAMGQYSKALNCFMEAATLCPEDSQTTMMISVCTRLSDTVL